MPNPFKIGSIAYDNWNYENPTDARDVLGEAKGALGRADQLSAETDSGRLVQLPASLAALREPRDTRGPVRKITEPLASGGNAAMMAGIPAGLVNPAIGGAMLSGGGLATLPDYFRRLIAPEGDESRPGIVDTGMAALAAAPAVGLASKSLRGLQAVSKWDKAAEIPYAMESSAPLVQDISQWEKTAQPLSESGLAELSRTIARNTRTPEYRAELGQAQSDLTPSGVPKLGPNGPTVFDRMANEGQFAGQRALPRTPTPRPPAPRPRGRDFSKPGKPSLAGLRADIINKESLHRALSDFQP